jgi:hypothetical protein
MKRIDSSQLIENRIVRIDKQFFIVKLANDEENPCQKCFFLHKDCFDIACFSRYQRHCFFVETPLLDMIEYYKENKK